MSEKKLNFNTLLIGIFGGGASILGTLLVGKMDHTFTEVTKLSEQQGFIAVQVGELKQQMKDMVLKGDFQAEIGRLNREIELLKRHKP